MIVTRNIIASSNARPELQAGAAVVNGVVQIREVDSRGQITREGRVVLFGKNDKGDEVVIMLTPTEAAVIGPVVTHLAWVTMGEPPPAIEVKVQSPTAPSQGGLIV